MTYSVKEIFYTLQGEGFHAGRPAVFCRFAGCNLWSGREQDRASAVCNFCDTEFVGTDGINGDKFPSAKVLASRIESIWLETVKRDNRRFVVCTGGEPLLQLDDELVRALHDLDFEIAVETNGTQTAPDNIDWICVSPKSDSKIILRSGNELKLVYPQSNALPEQFESLGFEHFYLQPMDGPRQTENIELTINYCRSNPYWTLSLQTHKITGIP